MIRPRALRPGDTVALVAPASRYDADVARRGADVLASWGLSVELRAAADPLRYLSAPDDARASALTAAFTDDNVAAIIGIRGGYGSARLLGRFDPALAGRHPKIFVGYSDLSILLWRFRAEAGLVCFHGPMVASDLSRLSAPELERFRRFLFGEDGWWAGSRLRCLVPGQATGPLVGGCLAVLETTLATSYEPDLRGAVLFLEDVAEPPYKIDRLLTHLRHAGKLEQIGGVVLGSFKDCGDATELSSVFEEILGGLGVPVVAGFDAGHGSGNAVLPIGCQVRLDAGAGTIELLEPVLTAADALSTSGAQATAGPGR